ncbi:DASH complex subunit Dad4 [Lobosporangium transversale]|uniref:DASH complex subunit DAD4 n=1 Tax=Lobosporangium transversale TaxID=64571 RepID=A0A1Y2GBT2_9FUNG|nr:DASH complex subunit Dad4 [Lobosporangium transversale]ORZ01838.1 DASH complex subunit Dad4 [Lobosporangium transversale]|eukprot:XP_021876135.1 DASH complex subunit Dad4 [Lobosporangium transversale]
MDPHQEQQAALLNRIALNVEKLNESVEQLNEKLKQINEENHSTAVIAQIWNNYSRNVYIMLEGLGGLQPPE